MMLASRPLTAICLCLSVSACGSGFQTTFAQPRALAPTRSLAKSERAPSGIGRRLYAAECCGLLNNGDVSVYPANLERLANRMVQGTGDARAIVMSDTGIFYLLTSGPGFYTGIAVNEFDPGAKSPSRQVNGFLWADAIAVDRENDLYVADCNTCPDGDLPQTQTNDDIFIYRPKQTKVWRTITKGLASPRSIAVDGDGYLYVANAPNPSYNEQPSIAVYAPKADAPLKIITQGISNPSILTTDEQNDIYVSDGGAKVLEYSQHLARLLRTITDQVASPTGFALDGMGTLYVSNSYSYPAKGSVSVYEPGSSKARYVIVDEINNPVALAVSRSGDLYVADGYWGLPGKKGRTLLFAPSAKKALRSIQAGGRYGSPFALVLSPVRH
jgi:sugar lactone lactonase YvrE